MAPPQQQKEHLFGKTAGGLSLRSKPEEEQADMQEQWVEEEIASEELKLSSEEFIMTQNFDEIQEIKKDVRVIRKYQSQLSHDMGEIKGTIDTLKDSQAQNREMFSNMNNNIGVIKGDVGEIKGELSGIKWTIGIAIVLAGAISGIIAMILG